MKSKKEPTITAVIDRLDAIGDEVANIKKAMATKDDLRAFATKDDLRAFSTKDDLRAFATKDDLRAFATKDDLNKVVDRITGHIDGLWGESRRLESVALMQSQRLKDEHEQLNDHERRIVLLEKKIAI